MTQNRQKGLRSRQLGRAKYSDRLTDELTHTVPFFEKFTIGSGVIESGNRYVMQERLKLPGMRWDVDAAQKVLALKCKYDSGLWQSLVVPLVYKEYGLTINGITNN